MRIPVSLAWVILGLAFFTAGVLRQHNDQTPISPFVSPVVGSALFAGILLLLLVAAREWRRGAVPGKGVRLGSLTPILLMLLIEKWVALTVYPVALRRIAPATDSPALADAVYRSIAGIGLLLICLLVGRFSMPTARKTWRRARPSRWPAAALQVVLVVGISYLTLGLLARAFGGSLTLRWATMQPLLVWVLVGQAVLAFAEEIYYRGLLLSEMERLSPRLGASKPAARRWVALLSTSLLFGLEHLRLGAPWDQLGRQLTFTVALGLLLGLLVMLSANLHLVGGIHAWINWLLLGAAPVFVDFTGRPALPPGTYIGLTLVLAFIFTFVVSRRRHRASARPDMRRSTLPSA